jgi:hypothetical protein
MLDLLVTLTPIRLIDSLSLMPFAMVVLATLLSGPKPYVSSISFLLGTALSYFVAGVLIAFGLGGLIERITVVLAHRFWNPQAIDYWLSMVIGLALIVLGYRWAIARRERAERKDVSTGMTPPQAFMLGAGATIAGLWGALPYFAAVDQILKANVSMWEVLTALAYYNIVFISLAASLVLVRAVAGAGADGLFAAVNRLLSVWGKRLLIAGMILLGIVMIADGVGWLLGHPLIPVC